MFAYDDVGGVEVLVRLLVGGVRYLCVCCVGAVRLLLLVCFGDGNGGTSMWVVDGLDVLDVLRHEMDSCSYVEMLKLLYGV